MEISKLTSSKAINKNSVKDLYHEMKKRIRIILSLIGKVEPDKKNVNVRGTGPYKWIN